MDCHLQTLRVTLSKLKDVNSAYLPPILIGLLFLGLQQLESKKTPIEKYIYLSNLRNTNVHLFYRLVVSNLTVGYLSNTSTWPN